MKPSALPVLLLAAALAAGAGMYDAWRGLAVSHSQKLRNLEAWTTMSESERDAWRSQLELLEARPREDRDRLYRRHAALNRMRQDSARVLGRSPTRPETEEQLGLLPARIAELLGLPDADFDALQAALTERISERLGAFLDNLVRAEELSVRERAELDAQPFAERIDSSLMLQKRLEIHLYVERHAPSELYDIDPDQDGQLLELTDLDPLDVSERLRQLRQNQGLLGRAGRELALSEAELAELAETPKGQVMRVLARMYRPRIRVLLEERDKDPEHIEKLLALPPRQLERMLNRLLLEQP